MEPKTPEDIYKSHLEQAQRTFSILFLVHFSFPLKIQLIIFSGGFGGGTGQADSAKMNLANAIVNGFVNMGFGVDKFMTEMDSANSWFYKNKDWGLMTAAASLGLIHRWDVDSGLNQCDRFLYVQEDFIKV